MAGYLGGNGVINQTSTAGSTITGTVTQPSYPAGTTVLAMVAFDNLTASTPTVTSITSPGGETWTKLASQDAHTATAAGGIRLEIWGCYVASTWAASPTMTVNLSGSVVSRAVQFRAYSGVSLTVMETKGAANASTGGTSLTFTTPTAGQTVVGFIGYECFPSGFTFTYDTDTVNGSWSPGENGGYTSFANPAVSDGAITYLAQHKFVTADGSQTWNPTVSPSVDNTSLGVVLANNYNPSFSREASVKWSQVSNTYASTNQTVAANVAFSQDTLVYGISFRQHSAVSGVNCRAVIYGTGGALVASSATVSVTAAAGELVYFPLTTPVTLAAGVTYRAGGYSSSTTTGIGVDSTNPAVVLTPSTLPVTTAQTGACYTAAGDVFPNTSLNGYEICATLHVVYGGIESVGLTDTMLPVIVEKATPRNNMESGLANATTVTTAQTWAGATPWTAVGGTVYYGTAAAARGSLGASITTGSYLRWGTSTVSIFGASPDEVWVRAYLQSSQWGTINPYLGARAYSSGLSAIGFANSGTSITIQDFTGTQVYQTVPALAANKWYRFEVYFKRNKNGVANTGVARLSVYDENEKLVGTVTNNAANNVNPISMIEFGSSGGQSYVDEMAASMGLDGGSATEIGRAAPGNDNVGPTDARVNYVLNPRCTTTTGWAFNNFFGSYSDGYSITAVTLPTAGPPVAGPYKITTAIEVLLKTPVAGGVNNMFLDIPNMLLDQCYSASCWVYNPSGGADYIELGAFFFNSPGGMRTYLKDQWVRLYTPGYLPADHPTTEQFQVLFGGTATMENKKAYVTGLLVETVHNSLAVFARAGMDVEHPDFPLPGPYFDGNNGGGKWLGVANGSQSRADIQLTLNQYELNISDGVGLADIGLVFGQDYFATPADNEGLTDQRTVELGIGRTQPDGIGITDAVTMARALAQVKNEPMGLTDVVSLTWDYARILADSEGVTEVRTVEMSYGRIIADGEGLTDPVAKLFERPVSDNVGVTDTGSRFDISGSSMEMLGIDDLADPVLVQLVNTPVADDAGVSDVVAGEVLYDRPTADNETLTDTAAVGFGFGRVPTDSANLNDAITPVSGHVRLPADTEGLTDAVTLANDVQDAYADTEGITDQQTVASAVNRSQADNLGLTDAFNVVPDVSRADQVTMTDSITREVSRTIADNVGLTDPQTRVEDNALTQADGIGTTDTAALAVVYVRTINDGMGLSDNANSGAGLFKQQDDTAGLSDTVTTAIDVARSTADDTGLRDTPDVALTHTRAFADGMGMTDTAVKSSVVERSVADTSNLADLMNPVADLTLNDSTQVTDSRTVTTSFGASDMDEASIIDNVVLNTAFGRTTIDTASLTDAVTTAADYSRTVADPANITDAVERTTGRPVSDAEGLTDQTATVVGYGRPVADSVGLSDTVSQVRVYVRTYTDQNDLSDTLNIALSSPTAQSYVERVDLSDTVATSLGRERTVQDNLGLTDTRTVAIGRGASPADTVGVTDTRALVLVYHRTLPDDLGMTDSIAVTFGPGAQDDTGLTDNVDAATLFMRTVEDVSTLSDDLLFFLSRNFVEALPDTVGITDTVTTFKQITRDIDDGMNLVDRMGIVGMNVIPLLIEDDVHLDDDADLASKSPYTRSNYQYDDLGMTDSILYVVTPDDFVPFIGWGQSI